MNRNLITALILASGFLLTSEQEKDQYKPQLPNFKDICLLYTSVKIEHEVVSLNVKTKTIEVKNLQSGEVFTDNYDRLMIATGAATVIPPIKNIENAYTLRSVEDGEKLKAKMQDKSIKKIAVIGAGFIGCLLYTSRCV